MELWGQARRKELIPGALDGQSVYGAPMALPVNRKGVVKGTELIWTNKDFFLRLLVCSSLLARPPTPG